jgi:hypothetical protein
MWHPSRLTASNPVSESHSLPIMQPIRFGHSVRLPPEAMAQLTVGSPLRPRPVTVLRHDGTDAVPAMMMPTDYYD